MFQGWGMWYREKWAVVSCIVLAGLVLGNSAAPVQAVTDSGRSCFLLLSPSVLPITAAGKVFSPWYFVER